MKRLIFFLPILIASCGTNQSTPAEQVALKKSSDSVSVSPDQLSVSGIEVGKIQDRSLSGGVPVTGMLDVPPQNLVNVTVPLGGFLRSTTLLPGMKVTKGQVIAVIENPEYIQLQQDYLETKSQVFFLEKEYERQQKLAAENINAQKTLQKSLADWESMKARNNGLRAKLRMLGIDAEQLKPEHISSTIELKASMSGYVTQVFGSVGAFVAPTQVMFAIVDSDHLHVQLTCFERDISRIRIGQKIRVTLVNESTERTATVFLIGRDISPERTVRIHAHLDKEDKSLIPGMYVKAIIQTGSALVPSLPEEAVLNFEDKEVIFIEVGDGTFKLTEVATGIRENGFVEVILPEGLNKETIRVAVRNPYKLLSKLKSTEEE